MRQFWGESIFSAKREREDRLQEQTLRTIEIRPIGKVRNSIRVLKREGWESVISEIIVNPEYGEALDGVEDYSASLHPFLDYPDPA